MVTLTKLEICVSRQLHKCQRMLLEARRKFRKEIRMAGSGQGDVGRSYKDKKGFACTKGKLGCRVFALKVGNQPSST